MAENVLLHHLTISRKWSWSHYTAMSLLGRGSDACYTSARQRHSRYIYVLFGSIFILWHSAGFLGDLANKVLVMNQNSRIDASHQMWVIQGITFR